MCRFAVKLSIRAHTWVRDAEIKNRRPCSPWSRHHDDVINGNIFHVTGLLWFTGEFPSQRPVTPNFDVFFDLRLYKRLCKQTKHRWFGLPWRSLSRHSDDGRKSFLHVCRLMMNFDVFFIFGRNKLMNRQFDCRYLIRRCAPVTPLWYFVLDVWASFHMKTASTVKS